MNINKMCQNVLHFVMEVHLSIVISLQLSFYFFLKPDVLFSDFPTELYFWKDCETDTEIPLQFLALLT